MSEWRNKEPTQAQLNAIDRMTYALDGCIAHSIPQTRGDASDEIKRLQSTIQNNLSIGGSINPRKSVYACSGDWGVDHEGN